MGALAMYGEGVVVVVVEGEWRKYVLQRARELGTDVLPFSEYATFAADEWETLLLTRGETVEYAAAW